MKSEYLNFLDATIGYLKELEKNGIKFICVEPRIINELSKPVKVVVKKDVAINAGIEPVKLTVETLKSSNNALNLTLSKQTSSNVEGKGEVKTPSAKSVEIQSGFETLWSTPELLPGQKVSALAQLREQVLSCKKCPHLVSFRHTVVFGVGNPNAELMFVGEAPGEDEDLQGEPFVGKAGQLLTKIIQTMGLSREIVYIANILKCRPDVQTRTGNRPPTPDEMKTCVPYLHQQIEIIRPRVIVALGATAVEGLLGQKVQITKLRGTWQQFRSIPVMPTYHPSYLLRNPSITVKREVWTDMLKVMEKLGMAISEKQRNYFTKSSSI